MVVANLLPSTAVEWIRYLQKALAKTTQGDVTEKKTARALMQLLLTSTFTYDDVFGKDGACANRQRTEDNATDETRVFGFREDITASTEESMLYFESVASVEKRGYSLADTIPKKWKRVQAVQVFTNDFHIEECWETCRQVKDGTISLKSGTLHTFLVLYWFFVLQNRSVLGKDHIVVDLLDLKTILRRASVVTLGDFVARAM